MTVQKKFVQAFEYVYEYEYEYDLVQNQKPRKKKEFGDCCRNGLLSGDGFFFFFKCREKHF
jgi:hypothetical protein